MSLNTLRLARAQKRVLCDFPVGPVEFRLTGTKMNLQQELDPAVKNFVPFHQFRSKLVFFFAASHENTFASFAIIILSSFNSSEPPLVKILGK